MLEEMPQFLKFFHRKTSNHSLQIADEWKGENVFHAEKLYKSHSTEWKSPGVCVFIFQKKLFFSFPE